MIGCIYMMCDTKTHSDDCSMLIVAEVKIEKLTMTHSSQSGLNGAVGSVSEAQSVCWGLPPSDS